MVAMISDQTVQRLLDHATLRRAVSQAHLALSRGTAVEPAPAVAVGAGPLDPAVIPMFAREGDLAVVKVLVDAPLNRDRGLPAQRSTVLVLDAVTAECVAVIEGRALTRWRTAAATAAATEVFARPGASVLGLVGAGALAVEHVRSHRELGFREVVVWSRSRSRLEEFRAACPADVEVRGVGEVGEVFAKADVICTLTPAQEPVVTAEMLVPGQHVNAVGSPPRTVFRELAGSAMAAADVVCVDLLAVALRESGNVHAAVAEGLLSATDLVTLGDVLKGDAVGRQATDEITIFNSVGLGIQDLAAARLVLSRLSG